MKLRPFRNRIDAIHPIAVTRDAAFDEAVKAAVYDESTSTYKILDESHLIIYGRLWLVLMALWDEINNQTDPGGPDFEELLWHGYTATADDVLEAMFG